MPTQRIAAINARVGDPMDARSWHGASLRLQKLRAPGVAQLLDYLWFIEGTSDIAHAKALAVRMRLHNLLVFGPTFRSPLHTSGGDDHVAASRRCAGSGGVRVSLSQFLHESVWMITKGRTGLQRPPTYRIAHNLCDMRPLFGLVFRAWLDQGPTRRRCAKLPSAASSAGGASYPPGGYSHWAWIDDHTTLGDLGRYLAGGRALSRADVLTIRTFQGDAKEIFTAGQFSVFRHVDSVSRLWELMDPAMVTRAFNRSGRHWDAQGTREGSSMNVDEYTFSNAVLHAPCSFAGACIRWRVYVAGATGPQLVGASVPSDGRLVAAPRVGTSTAEVAANAAELRAMWERSRRHGNRTVRLRSVPPGRWEGKDLGAADGFFVFWSNSTGRWFKRALKQSTLGAALDASGRVLYYEPALIHTRPPLCQLDQAVVRDFSEQGRRPEILRDPERCWLEW
jgi:hypothetical protein